MAGVVAHARRADIRRPLGVQCGREIGFLFAPLPDQVGTGQEFSILEKSLRRVAWSPDKHDSLLLAVEWDTNAAAQLGRLKFEPVAEHQVVGIALFEEVVAALVNDPALLERNVLEQLLRLFKVTHQIDQSGCLAQHRFAIRAVDVVGESRLESRQAGIEFEVHERHRTVAVRTETSLAAQDRHHLLGKELFGSWRKWLGLLRIGGNLHLDPSSQRLQVGIVECGEDLRVETA